MVHFCDQKHHVVVIGAGFGGLSVVRELEEPGVSITIIDRSNHHLFQPLLYQVAGASLPSAEIAWPVRSLFRHREDVRTLMAEVQDVDTDSREVLLKDGSMTRLSLPLGPRTLISVMMSGNSLRRD